MGFEGCEIIKECSSRYLCQVEPTICPSSGVQIKRCEEVDCGLDSYEEQIICNSGQCSGCEFDNNCIPYGFRKQLREEETGGGAVLNMYCDIDGKLKEQKTTDSRGNWATCQNNYECESNLCSSGECVEIQKMLSDVSRFKSLGIRVFCKLAHLLNEENYNSCIYDFLGDEEPVEEDSCFWIKVSNPLNPGSVGRCENGGYSYDVCDATGVIDSDPCSTEINDDSLSLCYSGPSFEKSRTDELVFCPNGCEGGACVSS